MEKNSIGNLMNTTLENIKDMVEVGTVVGDALEVSLGTTVIPVSKVCFGFVLGGGEYEGDEKKLKDLKDTQGYPFLGGSGAGVSVQPVGFLVVSSDGVKMLPAQHTAPWERALNHLPRLIDDIKEIFLSNQTTTNKGDTSSQ